MRLKIKKGTIKDLAYIIKNLKNEDKIEMAKIFNSSDCFKLAFENFKQFDFQILYCGKKPLAAFFCQTIIIDGQSINGFKPIKKGIVAMLSTSELEKHSMGFLKLSKKVVGEWLETHDFLANFIYQGNEISIKWLKWLGFSFSPCSDDFLFFRKVK